MTRWSDGWRVARMDMFGFEAWLKEVDTTWDAIYKVWGKGVETITKNYEFMLIVLEKAIRPYYFFLKETDANANRPAGSPYGSERIDAGTAQERGGSATAKAEPSASKSKCISCGKNFEPK